MKKLDAVTYYRKTSRGDEPIPVVVELEGNIKAINPELTDIEKTALLDAILTDFINEVGKVEY